MERLERFLMPILIAVGLIALLVARADEGTVIVIARVVGVVLAIMLASGFIVRWVLKFRRGRRELDALRREYERLLAEQAAEEAADKGKEAEHA